MINLTSAELDDRRALLDEGRTLVYHLCEGQRGSKVAREFTDVATAGCLRHRLIAIHCCAVGDDEFRQWNVHAELADQKAPGGVVWSPFSNLWLYNQTTDVLAARRHGVSVSLGSDWGPSGTKNLLGELKVAYTWVRHAELDSHPVRPRGDGDVDTRRSARQGVGRVGPGRLETGTDGRRGGDRQAPRRSVDQPDPRPRAGRPARRRAMVGPGTARAR